MYTELVRNILEKSKDFDEHLTRIKTLNDGLMNRSEKLLSELGGLLEKVVKKETPPKCGICFTRLKTHCFVPCGHLVSCYQCSERAKNRQNARCFICRAGITDTIRVYC